MSVIVNSYCIFGGEIKKSEKCNFFFQKLINCVRGNWNIRYKTSISGVGQVGHHMSMNNIFIFCFKNLINSILDLVLTL